MKIKTNAENRKDVVKAAAEILNTPSKYLGVPSCNFQVGNCIIDRAGTVETEDEKTARCFWQDWWRGDLWMHRKRTRVNFLWRSRQRG